MKHHKQTKYSILELATVTKGSSINQIYKNSVNLAQKAEQLGYTRMWFAEHHNMQAIASSAPQILIAHIANATNTISVGSGGIMLPNHAPLIIAEQFGTLGHLFPNRIDLGLGRAPGTDQETARAIKPGFINAAHSFPDEVQKIQNYFSPDNKTSKVRAPVAEGVDVPIYILGSSTDSAHLAAQKGLPYAFASHFATAQLFSALHIYHNEFKPSAVLDKPYVIAGVNVIIADTDQEAEILSTSYLKIVIGILSGDRKEYVDEPSEMTAELKEIKNHPSVAQMTKYAFVGSKETVKPKIRDFIAQTSANELIAAANIYDPKARLKSFELFAEIMKELNEEK